MKWVAAATLLLLAAPALAEPEFAAARLTLEWSALDASAVALLHRAGVGDQLRLSGQRVDVATESAHFAWVGEAGLGTREPRLETWSASASEWTATGWSADATVFVAVAESALPAVVHAAPGTGMAAPPREPCARQPTYFDGPRPAACRGTSDVLEVAATARSWTVAGDFTVSLWSWDGAATIDGEPVPFWSGAKPTSLSAFGEGERELRHVHLAVTNGTLTLLPVTQRETALFASPVRTTLAAAPTGGIPEAPPSAVALEIGRAGEGLVGSFVLRPAAATAAGAPAGWPVGALGVAAVAVPLGAFLVRRNRGLEHVGLALENLELGNPQAAVRHARKALAQRGLVPRAALVGAVASLRGSDLSGAEAFLGRLANRPQHAAAHRFLLAHVRIRQGRGQEGQDLLEECLRRDPGYAAEAAADPVLAPFLDPCLWPRPS